tara:strand:+ start:367 stop:615 length:249 start_codon:yes stop_codon:yes gene_type:complete
MTIQTHRKVLGVIRMSSDRTLINFRVPDELIEVFDESCDFKNMNRTQTLIELMRGYVDKTVPEIQNWNTLYQMTGRTPLNRV